MLAHRQPLISSLRRDAWLEVDLNAIERNIAVIRSWLDPKCRLMAVVKSDAYGHGAAGVAEVLAACGASWLGVASIDEGSQLRESGVQLPILLLSPCPTWAIAAALEAQLTLTVTSSSQVLDISEFCKRQNKSCNIHLKIDTGMHRLGILPEKLDEFLAVLKDAGPVLLTGVFTHFAKADEKDFTLYQTRKFEESLQRIRASGINPELNHLASGEAARRFPQTHFDMVRVGLYLYGLEARGISDVVFPALSVRGRINQIQEIGPEQGVGYNLSWESKSSCRLASVPIGYADGIDRRLSNRMSGLLMGKEVKQVGLISMDQMLFDISNVPECQEGDVITLIGSDKTAESSKQIYLADWADKLDTITYELACRLRARMPRMYTRSSLQKPL